MYCKKCGEEINDEAVICPKCGCETDAKQTQKTVEIDEEKTGVGIACGLFLGLIGLIIGLCLYKEGTIARKTFLKAWTISFIVTMAVCLLIFIISMVNLNNTINDINNTYNDYYNDLYNKYY